MYGLDQFQLPHDPNSAHQLHWKPGEYGKGIIESNGVVHTWSVGGRLDGDPSHRRYMMEKGMGDPYPNQDLQANTVKFWIRPHGEVEILNDWGSPENDHYDQITAVDPRLTKATDSLYHFADLRSQDRVMHGPPKVVGGYQPASPEAVKRNPYNGRTPFVYHAPTNAVYVGKAGWHHDALRTHRDIHGEQSYEGYITNGLEDHPDETQRWPSQVEWTHPEQTPANHEEVLEAVSQHVGLPAEHAEAGWKFGTTADELTDMIMGMFPPIPPPKVDPEAERRDAERKADPLGFEIRNSWDREDDVTHNPYVEWVPTHELRPFIEYDRRPGGRDSWNNQERWDALGEHLKANGFKNPVWIDFNQDENTGHLSEGNHRVQLALDHGIPAVPVRVYRSRRPSPTQIKVTPRPEPQWEDQFDPSGYHYPEYMKPSHIGLPTVPPPGQHEAAYGDSQFNVETGEWNEHKDWEPGTVGKGLVYHHPEFNEPDLITWQVDDWGTPLDDGYHHEDMVHRFDFNGTGGDILATIPDIQRDGTFSLIADGRSDPQLAAIVEKLDPRLKARDRNRWNFGKVATGRPMYHVAPTYAREAIQRQGLMGHMLDHPSVESPWQQELGQPPGNYMFDDPASARSYVATLAARAHGSYPGDTHGEQFEEAGIFPNKDYGPDFAYVMPHEQEPPKDFHNWPDDEQDAWYEQEHERRDHDSEPYDHENPDHRGRMPNNLQGWDIWKVNANGLPVLPDPEEFLAEKDAWAREDQRRRRPDAPQYALPQRSEPRPRAPDEIADDEDMYDVSPPRWVTHEHVPSERLELHHHVPAWAVDDDWADDAHGEASEHEVPTAYTRLHPRHILPKGVPPEAREIWGKHLTPASKAD